MLWTRRTLLRTASVLPLGLAGCRPPAEPTGPGAPLPFLTPVDGFYVFSTGAMPPEQSDPPALRLGDRGRTATLPWTELRALATTRVTRTLICDGHGFLLRSLPKAEVHGQTMRHWDWRFSAVGTAVWDAVPVQTLFDAVGLPLRGPYLRALARDDQGWEFPVGILAERVMVAVGMNGAPLTHEHGAPARLIVAGEYGSSWLKWIVSLDGGVDPAPMREFDHPLYHRIPVRPMAFASTPTEGARVSGKVELAGVAYAGGEAVESVQLWLGDRGRGQSASWRAELLDPPEPYVWTRWRSTVDAPPGRQSVCIACIGLQGHHASWRSDQAPPEPDGWGGIHVLNFERT